MFCKILSSAISGLSCRPVYIELDISSGMPVFIMIGSVSAKVREAQDRVRTALKNMDIFLPAKRITINLAPGDIKKDSTRFDLPIAAALLVALEKIPEQSVKDCMIIGELHLNGETESVPGILPGIISAKELGINTCIVPYANAAEASNVGGITVVGIRHLSELIEYCSAPENSPFIYRRETNAKQNRTYPDFKDIHGQPAVKRAALIAAAGFHNILMCGPPGSGKSMAAKRIPSIMPELTRQEQLEVSRIYSIAGMLTEDDPIVTKRPFRAPHHSLSAQALCGGGHIPRPGEITLAHRGVLFLDELPEMPARVIEHLRGPLEDHSILISRSTGSFLFPSHFLFAAAMNPCPCGHYPDMNKCTCTRHEIQSYLARISKPVLDRIDIRVNVPPPTYGDLENPSADETGSAQMKLLVEKAFHIQTERYSSYDICFNSELKASDIKKFCPVTREGRRILEISFLKFDLSARAYHRILKLSRTIADLDGSDYITEAHISEAFLFRNQPLAP